MDISYCLQQVAVGVDENGFVTPTEKLTIAFVAAIESLGVDTVQMAHAS